MFIEWDPKLEIGIAHIDEQHKAFVNCINSLYHAIEHNKGHKEVSFAINALVEYAVVHFTAEQTLMEIKADPNRYSHTQLHMDFQRKLGTFVRRILEGETDFAMEVATFAHEWLINHISTIDVQLKGL